MLHHLFCRLWTLAPNDSKSVTLFHWWRPWMQLLLRKCKEMWIIDFFHPCETYHTKFYNLHLENPIFQPYVEPSIHIHWISRMWYFPCWPHYCIPFIGIGRKNRCEALGESRRNNPIYIRNTCALYTYLKTKTVHHISIRYKIEHQYKSPLAFLKAQSRKSWPSSKDILICSKELVWGVRWPSWCQQWRGLHGNRGKRWGLQNHLRLWVSRLKNKDAGRMGKPCSTKDRCKGMRLWRKTHWANNRLSLWLKQHPFMEGHWA